jgi:hypothetical protein
MSAARVDDAVTDARRIGRVAAVPRGLPLLCAAYVIRAG